MNKIIIEGKQEFLGIEIPIIAGGFGEGKRCILAKDIAKLHNVELTEINRKINDNIDEFEHGIDLIDIKNCHGESPQQLIDLGFSNMQIGKAKNIFLLSESGYMTLCMFMRTKIAKEKRQQFKREYFAMREVISSQEQLRNKLLLQLFSNDEMMVANAHKQLVDLETKPLLEKIETIEPMADKYHIYLDVDGLTDVATFSKNLGIKGLGRNNMYRFLKDNKYLMNDNNPYQKYIEQGIFLVKPNGCHTNNNGENVQDFKTYVTKKGVDYLINKLKKDGKIA
ncbi:phage antirepressor KilAC domain-containing protein [Terrisporobacter sp.]|uniref:phage antirepressor KilAC domain-containing protein n=1 Tax=Terrisporobacter sp. TaxID=1965305 RepID=UPI002897A04C|nr:phage antirepressor KilAC domain-containing protein [Terrisporobacter sp.]